MSKGEPAIRCSPKSAFVLIHGAFRGGWSWQKVRRIMHAEGFDVFAPSSTGAGEKSHLNSAKITLETWIADVVNLIEYEDLSGIILVGHSQGGVIIQAVAEQIPEKIARLVFLDAPVLRDGEAAIEAIPEEARKNFGETLPDALIEPFPLKSTEEFSAAEIEWINERLTAVPTNPSLAKLSLKNPQAAQIPRTFVFCTKTPPMYPASFTRRRFDAEKIAYCLIEGGHDCPLSEPQKVSELLIKIASD